MVGEVKVSIKSSWFQNLSVPDERSNRETSCRIGFYSVYLVSLQGLPFTLLYFIKKTVSFVLIQINKPFCFMQYAVTHKVPYLNNSLLSPCR